MRVEETAEEAGRREQLGEVRDADLGGGVAIERIASRNRLSAQRARAPAPPPLKASCKVVRTLPKRVLALAPATAPSQRFTGCGAVAI